MTFRWPCFLLTLFVGFYSIAAQAQSSRNRMVGDTLWQQIWYPVPRSTNGQIDVPYQTKYQYTSLADLVRKQADGVPVRAVNITDFVLAQGGWPLLRQLKDLQSIQISVSRQTLLDSLIDALAGLGVRRIEFFSGSGINGKRQRLQLPASITQFPRLTEITVNSNQYDLDASFSTLVGVKTLRELRIDGLFMRDTPMVKLPDALGKLTQLTSFVLQTEPGLIDGFSAVGTLSNLERLTISSYGKAPAPTDRQLVGTALAGLPRLRELAMPADWLPENFRADFRNMQRLDLFATGPVAAPFPAMGSMPQLSYLNLRNVLLPNALCSYKDLKQLIVAGDSLVEIPDCLGQLAGLEQLNLSGRKIRNIPLSIGQLTSLTALGLTNIAIDSVPDIFGNLKQLQWLSISNIQLKTIPASVFQLPNLTSLLLSNNKLTRLPEGIEKLKKLQELSLSHNQLTQLPDGLVNLSQLESLQLDNNQLTRLPDRFGRLSQLIHLRATNNQLVSLPDDLPRLDSLQTLSVAMNKLTSLPAQLGRLRRLDFLQVDGNQLRQLPESVGELVQLKFLRLVNNPLETLPTSIGSLTALTMLAIDRTKIRLLPPGIGKLRQLNSLQISQSELMTLPPEIGQCAELRSIALSGNPLIGLPASIGRLQKLTNLNLSGSHDALAKLMELPDSLRFCSALKSVQLSNFPNLDANEAMLTLLQLPALEDLSLTQTPLNKLPATGWKESQLRSLHLTNNALTDLPPALLDAPKLQEIRLFNNPLPRSVGGAFRHIDQLRVVMAEAGWVTMEGSPKKSWPIAQGFAQAASQKGAMRDDAGAAEDFDKAISYAADTLVAFIYGQRAEYHFFRKQYEQALADFNNALTNWPALRSPTVQAGWSLNATEKSSSRILWTMRRAMVRQAMGQTDAALTEINQAVSLLPSTTATTDNVGLDQVARQTSAQLFIEQGKLLSLKNQFVEADSAFSRAMRYYESMLYAEPAAQLTIVELGIVTGQYVRARKVLDLFPKAGRTNNFGYGTLSEYLEQALNVAEGKTTGSDAIIGLKKFFASSSGNIINWSFDLFDNWLNRTTLPIEKRDALRELTNMAKERQTKRN